MTVELELDENSTLYGDVREFDDSTSTPRGTRRDRNVEVSNLKIRTWVGNNIELYATPIDKIELLEYLLKEKYWFDRAAS